MESKRDIDELRRYPLSIIDSEYDRVLWLAENNQQFLADDIEHLKGIIENAKFWKNKYIDVNHKLWKLAEEQCTKF